MEAANDHWSLIIIGAFDVISREEHNAGVPGITIDAHIHTPLVHDRIPDDIGSPEVACDIITGIAPFGPCLGIKGKIMLYTTFLHLLYSRGGECRRTDEIVYSSPTHQIGGLGGSTVGAEDIVGLRRGIPDDAGVVDTDTLQIVSGGTQAKQCRE